MVPRPAVPAVFAVLPLLLLAVPPALAEQVYLSWHDSGYDLVPGYRYTVSLAASYMNLPFAHRAGEAYVAAGPLRLELAPSMHPLWGFHYDFRVLVNDEEVYRAGTEAQGWAGEVSYAVQIDVSCNGDAVVTMNGRQVAAFHIDRPVDILVDAVDGGRVIITSTRAHSCSPPSSGSYTPPPPPSTLSSGAEALSGALAEVAGAAAAMVALFMLGLVLIALMVVYKQAKRHKLI